MLKYQITYLKDVRSYETLVIKEFESQNQMLEYVAELNEFITEIKFLDCR
jgi:hypothetical protein